MEEIYFNGFTLHAQYIGYRNGAKVFICQDKLILTNKDNQVAYYQDITLIIMDYADSVISSQEADVFITVINIPA